MFQRRLLRCAERGFIMNKLSTFAVVCLAATSSSAVYAAQVGVGDFNVPAIGFGNPNPTAVVPSPLTIGPATFTDGTDSVVWWQAGNGFNDCIGGCVTTNTFGLGSLNVALDQGYAQVGLYVGQATAYSLDVSFYDAANNLLGTVVAAGAVDGVTFAGWRTDGAAIASVRIVNAVDNGFRVAAQSGYFQAAVPEPATWAMMIGGFGLVGGAMRRRARPTVTYA